MPQLTVHYQPREHLPGPLYRHNPLPTERAPAGLLFQVVVRKKLSSRVILRDAVTLKKASLMLCSLQSVVRNMMRERVFMQRAAVDVLRSAASSLFGCRTGHVRTPQRVRRVQHRVH